MNKEEYHWYPYLKYKEDCKKVGKEDTIQEWLWLSGKVDTPPLKPEQKPAPIPEWGDWKINDAGRRARERLLEKKS